MHTLAPHKNGLMASQIFWEFSQEKKEKKLIYKLVNFAYNKIVN